ncbi:MAG: hydroxymethylglutaryl-CoA lyase [Saprospiraceae bacterium]|nr:hydroxymethylglutaryl-CoA lyase [Saprospiraceae bacterium]
MTEIKIIECPRDAMQGIQSFIPTQTKIEYLTKLLRVGFDTIDFGSFVSPKAIPQLRDTHEVIQAISSIKGNTKLLAIVANDRGAKEACLHESIDYLGYPFSVSETFQIRNTNASIEESIQRIKFIYQIAKDHGKEMVIYISMAFGNPYGDPWNADIISHYIDLLSKEGIQNFALSDTIGVANSDSISYLFESILPNWEGLSLGAHFHTTAHTWEEKMQSAWNAGCRKFDGAIRGFGGCPMAKDTLTGNMPTENMIQFFEKSGVSVPIDKEAFRQAMMYTTEVFGI